MFTRAEQAELLAICGGHGFLIQLEEAVGEAQKTQESRQCSRMPPAEMARELESLDAALQDVQHCLNGLNEATLERLAQTATHQRLKSPERERLSRELHHWRLLAGDAYHSLQSGTLEIPREDGAEDLIEALAHVFERHGVRTTATADGPLARAVIIAFKHTGFDPADVGFIEKHLWKVLDA